MPVRQRLVCRSKDIRAGSALHGFDENGVTVDVMTSMFVLPDVEGMRKRPEGMPVGNRRIVDECVELAVLSGEDRARLLLLGCSGRRRGVRLPVETVSAW